jgi:predicted unusual protein kinase regulating ubiquinone biosynthesis (AarF/ABC1/UbiB family)
MDYIVIPNTIRDITYKYNNVIVMDFIDGVKLEFVPNEDKVIYAEQIMKFGLVTLMMHGVTHGDLHTGNVLFIKDGALKKLGILDFGIVSEINTEFKETLLGIILDFFDSTLTELSRRVLFSGIFGSKNQMNQLSEEDVNILIETTSNSMQDILESPDQSHVYKCINKFIELSKTKRFRDLNLRPCDDFIKLQMVIGMTHGVTIDLCQDNIIFLFDKVMNDLFQTELFFK